MMQTFNDTLLAAGGELYDPTVPRIEQLNSDLHNDEHQNFLESQVFNRMSLDHEAAWDSQCKTLAKFVINAVLAGVLCLIGLVGNSVSYIVLGRDRDIFPVARFLLRSLAVADMGFIVLWLVLISINDLLSYTGLQPPSTTTGWMYVRLIGHPLIFICQSLTIWLTVLIAATRCMVVCFPDKMAAYCSLSTIRRAVAVIAVLALAFNLPRFFDTAISQITSTNTSDRVMKDMMSNGTANLPRYTFHRTNFGNAELYRKIYTESLYYIFTCIIPFILLLVFNARLIIAYRMFHKNRENMRLRSVTTISSASESTKSSASQQNSGATTAGGHKDESHNVTLIMIVIIVVFIVCNAPAKIVQIAWAYRRTSECMTVEFFLIEISAVLELLSSSFNFIIYCAFLKRFCHHLNKPPCYWLKLKSEDEATMDTHLEDVRKKKKVPTASLPNLHKDCLPKSSLPKSAILN